LTPAHGSDVLATMLRKKSPRLAAAFVVTISAGCGGATTTPPDHPPTDTGPDVGVVKGGFVKGGDGKCYIEHPANPPYMEPADCETQQPLKTDDGTKPVEPTGDTKPVDPKPPETPAKVDDSSLPVAPAGWRVNKEADGSCRAFAPYSPCPQGALCNPPRPQTVKCPKVMPKDHEEPAAL